MTTYDGAVKIDTTLDTDGLRREIEHLKSVVESGFSKMAASGNKAEKQMDSLEDSTREAASGASNLGNAAQTAAVKLDRSGDAASGTANKVNVLTLAFSQLVARGIEKAIQGLTKFISTGVEFASDLHEVQNVVDSTFNPQAAMQINSWAKTASNAFGLSELQAKQFTGTIGAMFKAMGLTQKQTLDMSVSIAGLAGDLASFKNVKPEEALEKLRAGLSGESEPLKAWGILINETTVKTYAYKNGIAKAGQELTEQQKVLARYGLIMKQTKDAQGDFTKTAGEFANQQRLASNNLQVAAGVIGEKLIPILTEGLRTFNEYVEKNRDVLEQWGTVIAYIASIIIEAIKLIAAIPPNVLLLIGAIVLTITTFNKATKAINDGVGAIKTVAGALNGTAPTWMMYAVIIMSVVSAVALLLFLFVALTQGIANADRAMNSFGSATKEIGNTVGGMQGGSGRRYAKGTLSAPRGTAWVGENGPELVEFNGGERVYTATQSRALAVRRADTASRVINNTNIFKVENIEDYVRIKDMLQSERQSYRMGYVGGI